MDGSPRLMMKEASLIPVKSSTFERDLFHEQAARISAVYHDKTEQRAPKESVGEKHSLRKKILKLSLFPNIYNHGR